MFYAAPPEEHAKTRRGGQRKREPRIDSAALLARQKLFVEIVKPLELALVVVDATEQSATVLVEEIVDPIAVRRNGPEVQTPIRFEIPVDAVHAIPGPVGEQPVNSFLYW